MTTERDQGSRDDAALLWRELERLRAATGDVRDELSFVRRKLGERDDELRAARAEAQDVREELRAQERESPRELERVRAKLDERDGELAEARGRLDELARELRASEAAHEGTKRRYERLRDRRLVRLALWVAGFFRPLFELVRRVRKAGRIPPSRAASYRVPTVAAPGVPPPVDEDTEDDIAADALRRTATGTLPPIERTSGPRVTAVVLNRNGEEHLRRLLPALEETEYEDLDLVVVDNDSTDGSRSFLRRFEGDLALHVIENDDNASFAAGNNQGAAASTSPYVLLLNNDVTPMEPTWLARLVDTAVTTGAGAVGARLVYPPRPDLDNVGDTVHPDLTVQHRGVHFVHTDDGIPLPRNAGSGEDPLAASATSRRTAAAATAACLLVRRDVLEEVGGLHEGYVYGTEDVDLCLAIRGRGHDVVYEGSAVLWHHEFATQNEEGGGFKGESRRRNREEFVARWGPRVYREVLLDRIDGVRVWSEEPLRVAEPGDVDRSSADAIVVRDPAVDVYDLPRNVPLVGLVAGDVGAWVEAPWLDDLDVVVVPDDRARRRVQRASAKAPVLRVPGVSDEAAVVQALRDWCEVRRVAILVSTPSRDVAPWWGDTHYARALQRAFERDGYPTRVVLRDEFDAPWVSQADVTVHLLGLTTYAPRSGQVNALWSISHPELLDVERCNAYDVAFVASRRLAAELAEEADVPVHALTQATDPERFLPDRSGPAHELLFVANSRDTRRDVVDALLPIRRDLAVYGRGWSPDLIDPRHVRGELVPNEELPAYYASADVVLNDHWPEMREAGFISNRIYDAFAAGAFVVSDDVAGLDEEFDGAVVTFAGRDDLLAVVDRYLADPGARARHAARGRRAVLARHTFGHRVETIAEVLSPLLAAAPRRVAPEGAARPVPLAG